MKNLGTIFFATILALPFVAQSTAPSSEKEDRQIAKNQLIPLFVGADCLSKPEANQVNKAYTAATKVCDSNTLVVCQNAATLAKVIRNIYSFYAQTPCTNPRPSWADLKKSIGSVRSLAETYLNAPENAAVANGKPVKIAINDGVKVYEKLVGKCLTDESKDCIAQRAKPIQNIQNNLANALNFMASSAAPSKPQSTGPASALKEKLGNAKQTVVNKFRTLKDKITGPKK